MDRTATMKPRGVLTKIIYFYKSKGPCQQQVLESDDLLQNKKVYKVQFYKAILPGQKLKLHLLKWKETAEIWLQNQCLICQVGKINLNMKNQTFINPKFKK